LLKLDSGLFDFYYFQINFALAINSKALCSTVAVGKRMFLPVSHYKVFISYLFSVAYWTALQNIKSYNHCNKSNSHKYTDIRPSSDVIWREIYSSSRFRGFRPRGLFRFQHNNPQVPLIGLIASSLLLHFTFCTVFYLILKTYCNSGLMMVFADRNMLSCFCKNKCGCD
jgi:hypothetical protein